MVKIIHSLLLVANCDLIGWNRLANNISARTKRNKNSENALVNAVLRQYLNSQHVPDALKQALRPGKKSSRRMRYQRTMMRMLIQD